MAGVSGRPSRGPGQTVQRGRSEAARDLGRGVRSVSESEAAARQTTLSQLALLAGPAAPTARVAGRRIAAALRRADAGARQTDSERNGIGENRRGKMDR